MRQTSIPLAFRQHDHSGCIEAALCKAQQMCKNSGARLTPLRRRVLELLWSAHCPLGAYDLLARLDQNSVGRRRVTPASIYRALEFLRKQRLIHRIESRNAYIGCVSPSLPHSSQFFICSHCGQTLEMASTEIQTAIDEAAYEAGFALKDSTVETIGICALCQKARSRDGSH